MKNEPWTVHGEGKSIRNFIYVDDVARAFEKIILKGEIGEVYNIGTSTERSVIDICTVLKEKMNTESSVVHVKDRAFNDIRYAINSNKLHELGWVERVGYEEGMTMTIKWYTENSEYFSQQ